jgi:hypothetical protein
VRWHLLLLLLLTLTLLLLLLLQAWLSARCGHQTWILNL